MGKASLQFFQQSNQDVVFYSSGIKIQCSVQEEVELRNGLFASVGLAGIGFRMSPNTANSLDKNTKLSYPDLQTKFVSMPEPDFSIDRIPQLVFGDALEIGKKVVKKKKVDFKFRIKIGNPSLRKLMSGAIAGAVSRTVVAPLEIVRTHLMVGSCGNSTSEVFNAILKSDGWTGLFRGNLVNVIRVAPSKAIEGA